MSLCRDGVVLACEILDCCPWFEFADLDVYVSGDEGASTDPDSAGPASEDSAASLAAAPAGSTVAATDSTHSSEEDTFRGVLARAGLHLPPAEIPTSGLGSNAGVRPPTI